ncbi:Protein-glutamine gamma-glutamyltransferase K [Anabarilius grahami]|uniref:Protein-glutamine gamma-glutamyltransferase K n=1 Tax=Anabarilius grahami TaxID=495550 RepID=A0A3N0YG09_ANAGA|nr:Protein-glutamine gamma-glutamyltransferase K [Anabarilius grahami]
MSRLYPTSAHAAVATTTSASASTSSISTSTSATSSASAAAAAPGEEKDDFRYQFIPLISLYPYVQPFPPSSPDSLLMVRSVDLLKSKDGPNRREHRTDAFFSDKLIVRRGQTFQMWIEFSRPFNRKSDNLQLQLKSFVTTGIRISVPLVDELEDNRWEMKIVEQKDNRIRLSVNTLPNASIGRYMITVESFSPKGKLLFPCAPNDLYLLFNPWCEADPVFLDNEAERKEYVLNSMGRIYYGTENQIGARTWNYAQFEQDILEACLFLLERGRVAMTEWRDPVIVSRMISALVNSNDDRGVLMGNWSDSYVGGTSPTAWSGSGDILRQFFKSAGNPVKFGQCWVYAGVTTSVLRCLGIPTRCVSNFSSAHDTDLSLTTDIYIDEKLELIKDKTNDSVWNFHVWNESWMTRPDLPSGYGGWQVVDATPQEPSQGSYRCGPTPVSAVRNGQVDLKFDTPFVFAEVNSDRIYWQKKPDGSFSQISVEKNSIGQRISTKAVGSEERMDITHLYKYPEGSEEERIAVETASRFGSKPTLYPSPTDNDVSVEIVMDGAGPRIGEEAKLSIVLKNTSSKQRTASLLYEVLVMYYTGVLKTTVKKEQIPVNLKPQETKTIPWTLQYKEYMNHLVDQGALMLTLTGRVNQSKQILATRFNFRLRTPDLILTPVDGAVVGKELTVKIAFQNPLSQVLKNVLFRIEGLGMQSVRKIPYGDVEKLATVTLMEKFVPTVSGSQKLLASMDCRQLTQVHGFTDIVVKPK